MTSRLINKETLIKALGHINTGEKIASLANLISINIDSRNIKEKDIFIAIRGEFNDGHNYIEDALKKGASLILAGTDYKDKLVGFSNYIVFVPNTLSLFFDIARNYLDQLSVTKIAITGSNGKTSTKEMLKASLVKILGHDQVYANMGNYNNHFGLPLSALEVKTQHQIAIFEMGMNHAGEISALCEIVKPDIGAITNISHAHEGNFIDGIDGVMRAKGELFQYLAKNGGHAVINLDDERVVFEAKRCQFYRQTTFGHNQHADIRLLSHSKFSLAKQSQTVEISLDNKSILVPTPMAGGHHAHNVLCALAIVKSLGYSVANAALGIKDMAKTPGRMIVNTTKHGIIVINDAYNANPTSMKAGMMASLDFVAKRRIAAIGAMGELGQASAQYHFELGQQLAHYFDYLFISGEAAKDTVLGAKKAGMDDNRIIFTASSQELIEPLRNFLQKDDLIFIKGSWSAKMQIVAEALLSE